LHWGHPVLRGRENICRVVSSAVDVVEINDLIEGMGGPFSHTYIRILHLERLQFVNKPVHAIATGFMHGRRTESFAQCRTFPCNQRSTASLDSKIPYFLDRCTTVVYIPPEDNIAVRIDHCCLDEKRAHGFDVRGKDTSTITKLIMKLDLFIRNAQKSGLFICEPSCCLIGGPDVAIRSPVHVLFDGSPDW
jgi:hypothetical protein